MFPELDLELQQQTIESERFPFPEYGIEAVYHILLMKDALKNAERQEDTEEFVKAYSIDFTDTHHDCRFHADLNVFKQRGLYIPAKDGVEGHYFNPDQMNSIRPYLRYRSNPTHETVRLEWMADEVCRNPWEMSDFSNIQKIHNGLVYGQLMWRGALESFKMFNEQKLDQEMGQLTRGLLQYYEAQIGTIDINEG